MSHFGRYKYEEQARNEFINMLPSLLGVLIVGMICLAFVARCSPVDQSSATSTSSVADIGTGDTSEKSTRDENEPRVERFPNRDYPQSIVQLLGTPANYHRKKVKVEGFLTVRFESIAIYLSEADAKHGIARNGIWVSFKDTPEGSWRDFDKFDRKFVRIEGEFDMESLGHMGRWSGAIKNVDRVEELTPRW